MELLTFDNFVSLASVGALSIVLWQAHSRIVVALNENVSAVKVLVAAVERIASRVGVLEVKADAEQKK